METFKLEMTEEQQALLLSAYTFMQKREVFPKEYATVRGREV